MLPSNYNCLEMRGGGDALYSLIIHQFTNLCQRCSRGAGLVGRDRYRIEATDRHVYLICGDGDKEPASPEILRYNLCSRTWTKLKSKNMPIPMEKFHTALCDGTLFLWKETGFAHSDLVSFRFAKLPADGLDISFEIVDMNESPFDDMRWMSSSRLVVKDDHLYAVGGETVTDVLAFNIHSREWLKLYDFKNARDPCVPEFRMNHVLIFYNDRLYVFGDLVGSTYELEDLHPFDLMYPTSEFEVLHAFNLKTLQWEIFQTIGDFPEPKKQNECVQDPYVPSVVYINGGLTRSEFSGDTWRIDLATLTWTRIEKLDLPFGIILHSVAISPEGRLFVYGGFEVDTSDPDENFPDELSDKLYSAWIRVPNLETACWEAIQYYYRRGVYTEMVKNWLPQMYANRLQDSCLE